MGKSPAFQFYPGDWLSSSKIAVMSLEEQGAYIRLLCHAWASADCSIPDDDTKLAALSGMGEGWLNGGSTLVRECFVSRDGKLFNDRLLDERKKQVEWKKKSSDAGKKSGKARRQKKLDGVNQPSTNLRTKREPNTNSSVFGLRSSSSTLPNGNGGAGGRDIKSFDDIRNKQDTYVLTDSELKNVCASFEKGGIENGENLGQWGAQVFKLEAAGRGDVLREAVGKIFEDRREGTNSIRQPARFLQSVYQGAIQDPKNTGPPGIKNVDPRGATQGPTGSHAN